MSVARTTRRGVLVRIALVSLAQLVVFAALAMLVAFVGERAERRAHDRAFVTSQEVADLATHLDDAPALARAVERVHRERRVDLTVYARDGGVRATSIEPPLPPFPHLPPPLGRRPPPFFGPPPHPRGPPHDPLLRLVLDGGRGFVVLRPERDERGFVAPLLLFAAALLVVSSGSWLLARSIVPPLDALAESARKLGAGELKTRLRSTRDDELGEVARAFDAMADRLETLLRAEKELLANVSHELRTPLARIRVALDLASEGDTEAARAALAEIAIDLAELEQLVDDVMSATRLALDDGSSAPTRLAPKLERVEANALVDRSEQRFRQHHPAHTLEVERGRASVEVDPTLFRRALDNLLDNAAKYSPERSKVSLRVLANEAHVRFEVEDRGIGVADADLPRLFEPFFRADRSRTRGTGGVGLGLALAKRIVDEHGGTITVESRVDEGTCVTIELRRVD